jgi:NTE family protein
MPTADLVLEGGGVKGIGLLGAVTALVTRDDPYTFERYAGTSAGSILASFLAAGASVEELKDITLKEDFSTFEDESTLFKHFKLLGESLGLVFSRGPLCWRCPPQLDR